MKKFAIVFSSLLLTLSLSAQTPKGAEIKIKINHYKDSLIFLAHYYGNQQFIKDTLPVIKGWITIKQDTALEHGIYMIVPQDKKSYFDIIIHDEQHFTMMTDTGDYSKHMKVKGSIQNELFFEHNRWVNKKGKERDSLMKAFDLAKKENKTEVIKSIEEKIKVINEEVDKDQKDYIKAHPTHLLSKIFLLMQDVDLPDNLANDTVKYQYYKNHFWDKVDFSEEGLIRTPLFHPKLIRYLDKIIPQDFDSLIVASDFLVNKAKANPEMFKYVLHTITSKYERSQIMCFDAVFVHLVNKYYSKENCPWVNETTLIKMKTRAKSLQYVGCGQVAHDLKLIGLDNKYHQLSKIKSPYTVVWFWDSDCGHCKAQTPKLKKITDTAPFKDSIVVYAINIENETAGYKKFVKETGLEKWTNVIDTTFESRFRDYYDIYSTPVMYLLDKDKKIIAKRLDPEGLYDFLIRVWDLKIPQEERLFKESDNNKDGKHEEEEH
jgi:thiol-disulfide isomerase/thioredoxin